MKKRIHLILNGKGGVGKSFFACNFVSYLKERQVPHLAIDTDNENSTLKRFHREAEFVDLRHVQEIDLLFTALERHDLVVVDCRAASTEIFLDYFAEVRAFEVLETLNASLTVIAPVNHEADSVEQIKILTEAFGNRCGYLIVKNESHSTEFKIYDQSQTRRRLLSELAGHEIVMPKLYDWLVAELNANNLTIAEAISNSAFTLMDRQRLKNWQSKFNTQLETVREWWMSELPKSKKASTTTKLS